MKSSIKAEYDFWDKNTVFSLSRFFHLGQKPLPCYVAGRCFPEGPHRYRLSSQGLSILCETLDSSLNAGAWHVVKLLSKKGSVYQAEKAFSLGPYSSSSVSEFSYQSKGQVLRDWQDFLHTVESFFSSEGLAPAFSPTLVNCPGTEPHLKPFQTQWLNKGQTQKMYLATSPELHLKKLLCQDWTDFFEIKTCYRNGESGPNHQAEFTLLEWYRAFYSTNQLMRECGKLLSFLKKKVFFKAPLPPVQIFSMEELFKKFLNFTLSPQTSKKDLFCLLQKEGFKVSSKDSFEDLFFLIFLNKIECQLDVEIPTFICDWPPQLRAFARLNLAGWADRFELYWQGFELANGFFEVIDPEEQKELFKEQIQQRKDSIPPDEQLLALMQEGMPPVSGVALGLDRLFLAMSKKKDLRDIRLFPLS